MGSPEQTFYGIIEDKSYGNKEGFPVETFDYVTFGLFDSKILVVADPSKLVGEIGCTEDADVIKEDNPTE